MAIRLGSQVPNFQQDSTEGKLDFYEFLGDSWGVLFSHPADFTPVCTTELGAVAGLKPEWEKRNVKVIGLSVDPPDSHMGWAKDIEETQGHALNFPLIADADRSVSTAYDMLDGDEEVTATVRSVFVVDPNKNLRLSITYPPSTGRNCCTRTARRWPARPHRPMSPCGDWCVCDHRLTDRMCVWSRCRGRRCAW